MKKFCIQIMISLVFFCEMSDAKETSTLEEKIISEKALSNKFAKKEPIKDFIFKKLSTELVAKLKTEYRTESKKLTRKEAENFIRELGNNAFEVVRTKDIDSKEVKAGFDLLLKSRFGLMSVAGFTIGPSFKSLNQEEKEKVANDYLPKDLYNQFLSKFDSYKTSEFTVTGSKVKSYRHVEVESQLTAEKDMKIVWSVYLSKGSIRVYDVISDGVSASNILRSIYEEQMKKKKDFWRN